MVLATGSLSCGAPGTNLRPSRGVILITIDTLRADHLGCYGYERDTSPFLDSLSQRGALFENAFVQFPGTLPSHMSIFTALYPPEHGVYFDDHVLSKRIPTLPEVFQRYGFVTGGFTESGYVAGHFGFARGFDQFNDKTGRRFDDIEVTFDRGLEFLQGLGETDRFFLFLHTYSVHDPYQPPQQYASRYWSRPIPTALVPNGPNLIKINRGTLEISDTVRDYYKALYDAGINYMDDKLRYFFAGLDGIGLRDDVTVVITADHGEAFLEHGSMVHDQVYPEVLHVPLLVLHPGIEGQRIPGLVESVDIAPTLYELAGIPGPSPVSGRSFTRSLTDSGFSTREQAYAEMYEATDRTILRKQGNHLYQFMRFEPRQGAGGVVLMPREFEFDVMGDTLSFYARSYVRPRVLHIFVDGQFERSLETDEFSDGEVLIEIDLPGPGERKRITLMSPTCDPMPRPREWNSPCTAFFLRGLDFGREELYDLSRDPQGMTDQTWMSVDLDAFRNELETGRAVHRRHIGRQETDSAVPRLPEDVRERLKALGYLQ